MRLAVLAALVIVLLLGASRTLWRQTKLARASLVVVALLLGAPFVGLLAPASGGHAAVDVSTAAPLSFSAQLDRELPEEAQSPRAASLRVAGASREVGAAAIRSLVLRESVAADSTVEAGAGANPLAGTSYTSKVLDQMAQDTNHGFPSLVDELPTNADTFSLPGNNGNWFTHVVVPGAKNGVDGAYHWIIGPDGTINHRMFEGSPW